MAGIFRIRLVALPALLVALFVVLTGGAGLAAAPPSAGEKIRLVGNQAFSAKKLEAAAAAELADFARHHRHTAADDAAFRMELVYREAGYAFAIIDYRVEADTLTLVVDEGPRVLLTGVTVEGNSAFSTKELLALLWTGKEQPFVEARLKDGTASILARYSGEGYRQATVTGPQLHFSPDRSRVEATVAVHEGVRWTVTAVRYPPELPACVAKPLAAAATEFAGGPFFRRRKLLLKSRIAQAYGECGYPAARVAIREETVEPPGAVVLVADIVSGPEVTVTAIEVSGNERTDQDFIRERLSVVPGERYRESGKRQSFRDLYGTGLFSRVEIGLGGEAGSPARPLEVQVEEGKARQVSAELGWGSYELLRGRVGYEDRNLSGTGRRLRVEAGGSFKGAEFLTGVTDPWLLGSGITADLPLFYRFREEPSFTREESGVGLDFSKALGENTTATLGYLYRRIDISAVEADAQLEGEENGYNLGSIKFQANVDNRNDLFFPTTGEKLFAALEVADASLGSDIAYYRLSGGFRHFRELSSRLTLGVRYDAGLILPGRNQVTIPLGERLYSGGGNTVRSFKEGELGAKDLSGNPVGGMGSNVVSVELRRMLTDNVAVSLFADYGNLAPNLSRAQQGEQAFTSRSQVVNATLKDFFSDFRPALGCGVHYLLPVGPARLDVAWNPDRHHDRYEESVVVHFSIGMAF